MASGLLVSKPFLEYTMNAHFVRFRHNNKILTVTTPDEKTKLICFKEKNNAEMCKKFVSNYRSKFGTWPHLDLTRDSKEIRLPKLKIKNRTPEEVEKFLKIDDMQVGDMLVVGSSHNVEFMYCHTFDCNIIDNDNINIAFSGQHIAPEVDHENYINYITLAYYT